MSDDPVTARTRRVLLQHWDWANARRWDDFATLLAPDLRYEVPQTCEWLQGGPAYLDLFRTWPGDWQAEWQALVCDGPQAVARIAFRVAGQPEADTETGIGWFTLDEQGRIAQVIDHWPAPYDPPPRACPHLVRR